MIQKRSARLNKDIGCERKRLESLYVFEKQVRLQGFSRIAGVDEAGRGPLAGPVFAAACILPEDFDLPGLDDSKKISEEKRNLLFNQITKEPRIAYAIASASVEEIERYNILQATLIAMQRAVSLLPVAPDFLLVDGNRLFDTPIRSQAIVRGDSLSASIAAASILAKVSRDRLMEQFDAAWPEYGFKEHKGYGTKRHLEMLQCHGPCPIHRASFEPVRQLNEPLAARVCSFQGRL